MRKAEDERREKLFKIIGSTSDIENLQRDIRKQILTTQSTDTKIAGSQMKSSTGGVGRDINNKSLRESPMKMRRHAEVGAGIKSPGTQPRINKLGF